MSFRFDLADCFSFQGGVAAKFISNCAEAERRFADSPFFLVAYVCFGDEETSDEL